MLASELSWEWQAKYAARPSGHTAKRLGIMSRNICRAGGDDLRSLLTLPSVAVPNDIPPRPAFFPEDRMTDVSADGLPAAVYRFDRDTVFAGHGSIP